MYLRSMAGLHNAFDWISSMHSSPRSFAAWFYEEQRLVLHVPGLLLLLFSGQRSAVVFVLDASKPAWLG